MKLSTGTYALGVVQVVFGITGLVTGWADVSTSTQNILSGIAIFGLTQQNVKLGNSLGHSV